MDNEWSQVTLGEVAEVDPPCDLSKGEESIYIAMGQVEPWDRHVHEIDRREFPGSGARFQNGDTILARITPCLENGKTAYVDFLANGEVGHGSTEFIVLRARQGMADDLFVYYLARSPEFRRFAIKRMTGSSGRQRVPADALRRFELRLPPLREQRAIAHVLGTLDDKIELNRRMNETLEAMARAIFKSWFVDFDPVIDNALRAGNPIPDKLADRSAQRQEALDLFACLPAPGARQAGDAQAGAGQPLPAPQSEAARQAGIVPDHLARIFPDAFHDSPLGPIPAGWESGDVDDVAELHDSKRVPVSRRERAKRPGPYRYYGAAGVLDYIDDYLFDGIYVLVGEDGSVIDDGDHPIVQYVWGQFWVNNHAHVLTGRGHVSTEYLALFLKQTYVRPYITGAVQPKLNQGNLKSIPLTIPSPPVCQAFDALIGPLYANLRADEDESRTLAATRDALLPKLLSGETRVPDTRAIAEEAAL